MGEGDGCMDGEAAVAIGPSEFFACTSSNVEVEIDLWDGWEVVSLGRCDLLRPAACTCTRSCAHHCTRTRSPAHAFAQPHLPHPARTFAPPRRPPAVPACDACMQKRANTLLADPRFCLASPRNVTSRCFSFHLQVGGVPLAAAPSAQG
eukprot:6189805-Pleurochrysis_carterae.AAC.2